MKTLVVAFGLAVAVLVGAATNAASLVLPLGKGITVFRVPKPGPLPPPRVTPDVLGRLPPTPVRPDEVPGPLPPPRVTPDEVLGLGLPAGTPRAIADIVTEVRDLGRADRQILASEFPALKSIINPDSNDRTPNTTVDELAKVANSLRSSISQRADELKSNRAKSAAAALSLVSRAIEAIPPDALLTQETLENYLKNRIDTLAGAEAKTDAPRYTLDIVSGKLTLPFEQSVGSSFKVKVGEVNVYKIVTRLVKLAAEYGLICLAISSTAPSPITDCFEKIAEAMSDLVSWLHHDPAIQTIIEGGEAASALAPSQAAH
jgi:hypothetical protein